MSFRALSLLLFSHLMLALSPAHASGPADIDPLRQRLQQDPSLAEPQRQELAGLLDAAQVAWANAGQLVQEIALLRTEASQASGESRRIERELARDTSTDLARARREIESEQRLDGLETRLAQLYTEVEQLRREQQSVSAALAAIANVGAVSIGRLQEDIADAERSLASSTPDGSLAQRARRVRDEAELAQRRAELELARTREETGSTRRSLLELRQRLLRRQVAELEQLAGYAQARLGERSEAELAALAETLAIAQLQVAQAPPSLRAEAQRNVELGSEITASSRRLSELRIDMAGLQAERERIEQSLRDTEARLALGSGSEAVGAVLLRERQRLAQPESLRRQVEALRTENVQVRLRQFDVSDALARLEVRRSELVTNALEGVDDDAAAVALRGQIDTAIETRGDLLRRLELGLRRLAERLEQAEVILDRQRLDSQRLADVLDRQLFWIRSHRSVDAAWLRSLPEGWADLVKPDRFTFTTRLVSQRLQERPLQAFAGLLVVGGLFWLQRRARRELLTLSVPMRSIREDTYLLTIRALAWTLLAALPWAVLAWLAGQLLQAAGEPGRYTHSLGTALAALAGNIALFTFLRWLVIERGLAHAHFRWTRARRAAIARAVPWAASLLLPIQFLSTLAMIRGQDLAIDTAGRSLLMLFAVSTIGLFWWLFAPGRLWSPRGGTVEPARLRQLLRLVLAGLLLTILVLTLDGYVYTAAVLVLCLWQSGGAMLMVALLNGLLGRWFLLGERRLFLRRAEDRRAAAAADGDPMDHAELANDGEVPPEVEAEQLDIQSINAQTRSLLRAVSIIAMVLGLFWVWAEILPALQRLDEILLWRFTDLNEAGERVAAFVSLRSAAIGLAALVLTVVASRNLPGLLEIALLSRVNLDSATRYAITSVSRYAIVIVGLLIGLSFLGMRWSQLQWMAAALTVGLGFGLQEIFANFVSGLILLFERPFRVGDIITIGEFTGRVTRIRTRATTILDFDNKEVVIPNKSFITDRLTNWTLSDPTTRLIVKVGVAYGSDTALVHRVLMQAAQECEYVASEPAPRTWFLAFGGSSLDFELRVFVPIIEQRLLAQNDLHGRVDSLLREHGIEIAFPQMDLHVRELPPPRSA
ncbi:MAG: mechanosensitive ion channel [Aquimonas sp.]|nr:mechanosensitive ion channel [Aquimonas sp.]